MSDFCRDQVSLQTRQKSIQVLKYGQNFKKKSKTCISWCIFFLFTQKKMQKIQHFTITIITLSRYLHQKELCPGKAIGPVKLLFWLGVIYQHTKINMVRKTYNFEKWLKTKFYFILIYFFLNEKKTFLISNYEMYLIQS